MASVAYSFTFPYRMFARGVFPCLQLGVRAPDGIEGVEVDAFLDSGATNSLFDGAYLEGVGLDLMAGTAKTYTTTFGAPIEARQHRVKLAHDQLGEFELVVGFSSVPLRRNLLGRDFFDLLQIGFREHQQLLLIEPTP